MKFLALNFIFLSLSTQTIFAELATEFPHLEAAANSVAKLYIYNSEKSKKEFMCGVAPIRWTGFSLNISL